jgi:hypothetical protein
VKIQKTVLIHDNGLFPFVASKLAEVFENVLYFSPHSSDAFPVSRKLLWGSGLPGVTRVSDFFDHVDGADFIVFPDHGAGDLQAYLRTKGKPVWGSAESEWLELDRIRFRKLQQAKGMLMPRAHVLSGTEALRTHLEEPKNENQYIKLSEFRGDLETFSHKNWFLTAPWFRELDHKLGPMRESLKFVAEHSIDDAVEVGFDGVCIDGKFLSPCVYGYEVKDIAYVGKVCDYPDLPKVLLEANADLVSVLAKLNCRSFFSTELRVTQDGEGYLIDPCLRAPSPPSEALLEVFANWPEIFEAGSRGEVIEPIPTGQFCAELVLRSDFATDDFLAIEIPDEHRQFVKLHGHAVVEGIDYVVALGMDVIGGAVGIGDTFEDACEHALEVAKSLRGYQLDFQEDAFDHVQDQIEKGLTHGIDW